MNGRLQRLLLELDKPLSARALTIACALFLALYAILITLQTLAVRDGVNPTGEPLGQDFICFYIASKLTLAGDPAGVYGPAYKAAQLALFPGITSNYLWHYPPPAQLAYGGLALFPYVPAFLLWTGLTLALYLAVACWILPGRLTLLATLAAPATFWNAIHHQNGFVLGAVMTLGLWFASSRPLRAGVAIGLFAIKPHLAVLVPALFAAGRSWTAFIAAALAATGLMAASLIILGPETWAAFLAATERARHVLEEPFLPRAIMPTVFAAARLAGVPTIGAYALHGLAAAAAAAMAVHTWRLTEDRALRTAAGLCAAVLISPYLFYYDLTFMTLAGVCLLAHGRAAGLPRGAPGVLTLAWIWPLAAPPVAFLYKVQLLPLAPVAVLTLVYIAARRPHLAPRAQEALA